MGGFQGRRSRSGDIKRARRHCGSKTLPMWDEYFYRYFREYRLDLKRLLLEATSQSSVSPFPASKRLKHRVSPKTSPYLFARPFPFFALSLSTKSLIIPCSASFRLVTRSTSSVVTVVLPAWREKDSRSVATFASIYQHF